MKKTYPLIIALICCATTHTMHNDNETKPLLHDTPATIINTHKQSDEDNNKSDSESSADEVTPLLIGKNNSLKGNEIKSVNKFEEYIQKQREKSEKFITDYPCEQSIKNKTQKVATLITKKVGKKRMSQWNKSIEIKQHNYQSLHAGEIIGRILSRECRRNPLICNDMSNLLQAYLFLSTTEITQKSVEATLNELENTSAR